MSGIKIRRVGTSYELSLGGEVKMICSAAEVSKNVKKLEQQAFDEEYSAESSLDLPTCRYTSGVVCGGTKCANCGFRPEVSQRRIKRRFGKKALAFLSTPVEGGTNNGLSNNNRIRQ